jgi:phosphoenolpyruvate synthase/pyruvate phosphate dikinase
MTPDAESDLIVDLARLGAGDLNRGGGKATNLGELLRGGFPVPLGSSSPQPRTSSW